MLVPLLIARPEGEVICRAGKILSRCSGDEVEQSNGAVGVGPRVALESPSPLPASS